jgi:hypothetical protein
MDPTDPDLNPQHYVSLKVFLGPPPVCGCLFSTWHIRAHTASLVFWIINVFSGCAFGSKPCFGSNLSGCFGSNSDPTQKLGQVNFWF